MKFNVSILFFLISVSIACERNSCKLSSNQSVLHCIIKYPTDKSTIESTNVRLIWVKLPSQFQDPVYRVFLGFDRTNLQEIAQRSENYFDVYNLIPDSTYYWRFTAIDLCGYKCLSNVDCFTIDHNANQSTCINTVY
jgi:hypothetical protein